jgi:hypothetical protein
VRRPRWIRRVHPALGVLLALAALQGILWTASTAPLNGPDELAHFAYVQHLAETGHGPNRDSGNGTQSTELSAVVGQLDLYAIVGHGEARPAWDAAPALERQLDRLPDSARKDGSGPNAAGNYPPLYYAYGALAYRLSPDTSVLARLTAVRLAGVLLFVITVGLAWLIAAEVFTALWPRVLVAGLVALQPKLGFMAAVVNPDIMLVVLTTAILLVGLRLVRRGPTTGRVIGVCLLAGAGVMTHGRGLALVPPALVAIAIAWIRFRPGWRPGLRGAVPGAIALGAMVIFAVAWTRSHAGGGGAFGGQAQIASGFNIRQLATNVWQFYLPKLGFMAPRLGPPYGYRQVFIETGFGSFGSLEVNFRTEVYDALQVAAGIGWLALYTAAVRRGRVVLSRWAEILVALAAFVAMMGVLHITSYQSLLTSQDPIITGRYLLPCVALYGVAAAFVCTSLPRRLGPVLAGALLGASALLSLGGIGLTLERFYG